MLVEAADIIGGLFDNRNGTVNYRGRYFDIESAKLWDLPDERVPIGIAVSGPDSCELPGAEADLLVAVEPERELVEMFDKAGGRGKPKVGQVAIAYDPDRDAAIERAHDQFRWFGLGWKVNADLPNPDVVRGRQPVRDPRASSRRVVLRPWTWRRTSRRSSRSSTRASPKSPFVQIGADHQEQFTAWAERELLPALRSL